jgi:hypothetical protein
LLVVVVVEKEGEMEKESRVWKDENGRKEGWMDG